MTKKWNVGLWKSQGFCFLFHYQGKWNGGSEKRLYFLFWELNFRKDYI